MNKDELDQLIRDTDHIGRKYATPSTENGRESTVSGMVAALEIMLDAYPSGREPGMVTLGSIMSKEYAAHFMKVIENPSPDSPVFPMDLIISDEAYRLARRH